MDSPNHAHASGKDAWRLLHRDQGLGHERRAPPPADEDEAVLLEM